MGKLPFYESKSSIGSIAFLTAPLGAVLRQHEWFTAEPQMIEIVSNDYVQGLLILAALAAPNDSRVLITGVSYVDPSGI